jgi:hypothetical protein
VITHFAASVAKCSKTFSPSFAGLPCALAELLQEPRHLQPERLSGLEIDDEVSLDRLKWDPIILGHHGTSSPSALAVWD